MDVLYFVIAAAMWLAVAGLAVACERLQARGARS
jgi:hypothetical protein